MANVSRKNATDFALVIEAMDILHRKNVERFIPVSSDKTRVEYISELSEKCEIPFSLRSFRNSVVALIVDQDPTV